MIFSADWAIDYYERHGSDLDIEFSSESDSDNPGSGADGEQIRSQRWEEETFYWVCTSTGGPEGPFMTYGEAVCALGYDPSNFKL